MCAPIIMGIAALASTAVSVMGTIQQAKAQSAVADMNARELERQSKLRQHKADFDAQQAQNDYNRLRGKQEAAAHASGLDIGTFSDLLVDSALESALQVKQIHWTADRESENLEFQAESQRYNAKLNEQGAMYSALGTAIGGIGQAAAKFPTFSSVSNSFSGPTLK